MHGDEVVRAVGGMGRGGGGGGKRRRQGQALAHNWCAGFGGAFWSAYCCRALLGLKREPTCTTR